MAQQHKDVAIRLFGDGCGIRSLVLLIEVEDTDKASSCKLWRSRLLLFNIKSTISDVESKEIVLIPSAEDGTGKIHSTAVKDEEYDDEISASQTGAPELATFSSSNFTFDVLQSGNLIGPLKIQIL